MPPDPPRKGHSRTELNSHSRLLLYEQTSTSNLIESPAYVQICKIIYLTHEPYNLPPQLLPVRLQTYWTHSPELRLPLVTNRMQFYFCQSKFIVIESSVCLFPTGGMQKSKKIIRISTLEVWEFCGLSLFHGLSLLPFWTLRIGERVRFWLHF